MNQPTDQTEETRMPLTSAAITSERLEVLRSLIPEAFTEGKIDFDRLRQALGDSVDEGRERYGMSWAGKANAIRAIQTPSVGTLRPDPDESVDFDDTSNLFIEGDNLEVLKLLQKSYHSKVKLVYIDPPYNTGNEFIYPDRYEEGLRDYLKYSGQADDEGVAYSTNVETAGRFHSRWLNMMYPRLFLARHMLKPDGAIFVSVDDNEVHNLRAMMDEVFGPENFIATVIWQKVYAPKNTARHFSDDHDYVVIYARNADEWTPTLLPRSNEAIARYDNPDNDPRGAWKPSDLLARNYYSQGSYEVVAPSGKRFENPRGTYWRVSYARFQELDADGRIWWGSDGNNMPAQKRFLSEVREGVVPQTLWTYDVAGHTQEAKRELLKLVDFEHTDNVLNSLKPARLIERILQIATTSDDGGIVLDFFAGSGVTGDAVMRQNTKDDGNRRFVLVQLPETLKVPESKMRTLFDMGVRRLRAAGTEQKAELSQQLLGKDGREHRPDLGFRVLRLTDSNFKIWDASETSDNPDTLAQQLRLYADHVDSDASDLDILYELMLKAGMPLTTPVEEKEVEGRTVYSLADGLLIICLERSLTRGVLRGIQALEPKQVICLDQAFGGNDQLKTNTVLEMRSHDIEFRTV